MPPGGKFPAIRVFSMDAEAQAPCEKAPQVGTMQACACSDALCAARPRRTRGAAVTPTMLTFRDFPLLAPCRQVAVAGGEWLEWHPAGGITRHHAALAPPSAGLLAPPMACPDPAAPPYAPLWPSMFSFRH